MKAWEGTRGQGKRQPGAATLRCSSHAFLLQVATQSSQGDPGKPCLELQGALSKQLPPEMHRWQRHCASAPRLRRSTLPTNAWERAEGGRWKSHRASTASMTWERALSESLRLNTTLATPNLSGDDLGEGGGRVLAEALRLNTTHALLYLHRNDLGESDNHLAERGARALAETLRLNTTVTSLDLGFNHLAEGGGRALTETQPSTPRLRRSTLAGSPWRGLGSEAILYLYVGCTSFIYSNDKQLRWSQVQASVSLVLRNDSSIIDTQHPTFAPAIYPVALTAYACLWVAGRCGGLKTLSSLVQTRPARSLLMRLPPVGPRGYRKKPYSTVHSARSLARSPSSCRHPPLTQYSLPPHPLVRGGQDSPHRPPSSSSSTYSSSSSAYCSSPLSSAEK
jgi:hypothetical protein